MALKIQLAWDQTAYFCEEIELDAATIASMEASGVDYMDPEAVFNWMKDNDDLIKYEPFTWGDAEYDKGSSKFVTVGFPGC